MFGFADGAEDAGAPVEAAVVAIVFGAIALAGIAKRSMPGRETVPCVRSSDNRFVGRAMTMLSVAQLLEPDVAEATSAVQAQEEFH